MTVEDLTHVGWICAAEKVDNYDLEKGASIMTFLRNTATWGMRDHIKSQEVHNKYNPFDDSDGDEDFITHKDSSYHMSEFEESLDVITILELLDDEEAQEMLIMWMSGATYVAIGEEFGYEQSWTRRKIEGWVTHLKTKLHVDIEILKDETF